MQESGNGNKLQAPFPWFGGKSRVASLVWERFGADIPNLVEPFFGSGAVLLGRPGGAGPCETANDLDGFICNFWRAIQHDPEQTAHWADQPVNECDLTARHIWLLKQKEGLGEQLLADPEYYDPKIAGYWCWGICCWIGSGWCSGNGPWTSVDGKLVHLGDLGQGVNRKLVHLGNLGQGVNRQRDICTWFAALANRLERVRVCCGDWERVCGPSPTTKLGLTGVFLDPPYSEEERTAGLYAVDDDSVAKGVREWAIARGDDPLMRIALCGYWGEHIMPGNWQAVKWKAAGGYGSQGEGRGRRNAGRETIWFSPHCLSGVQGQMVLEV